ncbi:MAG: FlgD immunoglobulin-like domain containing protein [Candidatus Glassbacteria bacterium]
MKRELTIFAVLGIIYSAAWNEHLFSWTLTAEKQSHVYYHPKTASLVVKFHDFNEVLLAVSNTGQIGIDLFTGNGVGFWPARTPNNYVFGTGLWLAAIYDADDDGTKDTVFTQSYNPIDAGTDFREGRVDQSPSDPLASVFSSTDPDDLQNWPPQFSNQAGDPIVCSGQDIVTTYTTIDATPHYGMSMPLEVNQRSMAVSTPDSLGQVIFFLFEIENVGEKKLEDAWIAFDSDMDIGSTFTDDRTSLMYERVTPEGDTVQLDLGFAWDNDFDEGVDWVGKVGFVGITMFLTPGNYDDGVDNDGDGLVDESPDNGLDDDGDGQTDEWDEVDQMGFVHYTFHCNPSVCSGPGQDPESDPEGYRMISCTPPDECIETTDDTDIRFLMSSGPFDWYPGEKQRFALALVFADPVGDPSGIELVGDPPRPDPNDTVFTEFVEVTRLAREYFPLLLECSTTVGIEDNPNDTGSNAGIPKTFILKQNYPNPFNPETTISFDIPGKAGERQRVGLGIYDLRGRHVKTLVDSELDPGTHRIVWDGRDKNGEIVPSGIYFYTLRCEDTTQARKMSLIK